MANLMLSVVAAIAEFERYLVKERQKEGIALAKQEAYDTRVRKTFPELLRAHSLPGHRRDGLLWA
jgi:DNA invertase Pin-like site-specific DNA recombinase